MLVWQKMLEPDYVPPKRKVNLLKERRGRKRKRRRSNAKSAPKTQQWGSNAKSGGQTQQVPPKRKSALKTQRKFEKESYGLKTENGYFYVPLPPPDMKDIQARLDFEWNLANNDIEKHFCMFDVDAFNAVMKDRGYSPKWGDIMLGKALDISPRVIYNRRSDGCWNYWQIILIADILKMTPLEFLNCFFSGCFEQDEKGNTYVKCNSEDIKRYQSYKRGRWKHGNRKKPY